jgi:hypothetical protein
MLRNSPSVLGFGLPDRECDVAVVFVMGSPFSAAAKPRPNSIHCSIYGVAVSFCVLSLRLDLL